PRAVGALRRGGSESDGRPPGAAVSRCRRRPLLCAHADPPARRAASGCAARLPGAGTRLAASARPRAPGVLAGRLRRCARRCGPRLGRGHGAGGSDGRDRKRGSLLPTVTVANELAPRFAGWVHYLPDHGTAPDLLLVGIPCLLEGQPPVAYALLDTASPWSLL